MEKEGLVILVRNNVKKKKSCLISIKVPLELVLLAGEPTLKSDFPRSKRKTPFRNKIHFTLLALINWISGHLCMTAEDIAINSSRYSNWSKFQAF